MKIATILAIANNSGDVVTLELRSESAHPDSIKVGGGETWLERPIPIPLVNGTASPLLNHVAVSRGTLPNLSQAYLWRDQNCIYVNEVPDQNGAEPLKFTDLDPDKPVGLRLLVNVSEVEGGGWVIGDIIGAKT